MNLSAGPFFSPSIGPYIRPTDSRSFVCPSVRPSVRPRLKPNYVHRFFERRPEMFGHGKRIQRISSVRRRWIISCLTCSADDRRQTVTRCSSPSSADRRTLPLPTENCIFGWKRGEERRNGSTSALPKARAGQPIGRAAPSR